ncbi:MAG TPA: heavy-metal-associated domain-containing protein [Acidobacteriaceae bacterium]|jgi:copper chaperone CopZ|nr:heavy-metal-associated domain-containing protein [Acidobacteriaceae bacterium]
MTALNLSIENMHCGSCVRRVTQTLNALPSTHAEEVQIGSARIRTEADPQQIEDALRVAGYPAHIES